MPTLIELLGGPALSAIAQATGAIFTEVLHKMETDRTTASQASRDEDDYIRHVMFWDWRNFLQKIGAVGDPPPRQTTAAPAATQKPTN